MPAEDQQRWDKKFSARDVDPQPAAVLSANQHLLPSSGLSLDIACGFAGNAFLLAEHGLDSHAWDVSGVAIEKLQTFCTANNKAVTLARRDIIESPPPANSFDVISVSRFLHRALCPALIAALKPNGLLFYQTFTQRKVTGGPATPSSADFCLADGELLTLFADLQVYSYREDGDCGDASLGLRNQAWLVARKPA